MYLMFGSLYSQTIEKTNPQDSIIQKDQRSQIETQNENQLQQANEDKNKHKDEEQWKNSEKIITVTGSRRKKLLKDSIVKTEVISREDLDAMGARTVADSLGNVPGIEVRPAQPGQRGESVRLQGLSAQNVLILVDGQRVTGRFNG